jgi:galactose mutarotase-like enzyme
MPFSLGFHPYFQVFDKNQLTVLIPGQEYFDHKTGLIESFSGTFNWTEPEIDVAFLGISRHSAAIRDGDRSWEIALNYSHQFSTLVFWTIQGKDYVCLEPWTAPRNAINTGESLTVLAPEQVSETVFDLRVTNLK